MRTEREHGWRVAVVVFAAAVTVTAVLVPAFRLHLDSPASGAIALALRGAASLFVCALAAERFARTASRLDATIGVAFGILAVADLGFALDRAALSSAQVSSAPVLPYRVIAAAVLAWAAVAPDRVIVRRPRTRLILLSCGVVIIPVFVAQRLGFLPGTDVAPAHEPTEVVVLRALIAALLAVAAIGLTARRDREGDPLVRWLAVALAVGVLVQVQRL